VLKFLVKTVYAATVNVVEENAFAVDNYVIDFALDAVVEIFQTVVIRYAEIVVINVAMIFAHVLIK
jgi:hypothetical protein